jgi:hypothetical protein
MALRFSDALVTGNEWECGLQWPVAMRGMEIGVADAAGFSLDQNLAGSGRRDVPFLKHQGLAELLDNCGLHLTGHGSFLVSRCNGPISAEAFTARVEVVSLPSSLGLVDFE